MPLLHENQVSEITSLVGNDLEHRYRRQMLIALILLVAALIMVLAKDYYFWFPPAPQAQSESEPEKEPSPEPKMQSETATTTSQPVVAARPKALPAALTASAEPNSAPASAAVVTSRAVLPPLQVEIVAGDERRTVQAGNNSVKVDLSPPFTPAQPSSTQPTSGPASVADATARVHLSPSAAAALSRPVEPNYPMLAKQMRVQGAVILEALVGRDGNIQALRVLSGPAILSVAAREAVKQWRFKPYLQSGQTVETKARIVVNFTILTS